MLLDRGWHLAVCVTDLPLQTARRPVIAHVSAVHGIAVLSMPALGPLSVRKRAAAAVVRLIGHMLGDVTSAETGQRPAPADAVTRRMRELGTRAEHKDHGAGFAARVISGNIWLLLGMLRANRPWRLALRLMRVLVAAFAAGVFALVTSDIWRLAEYLGPVRLTVIASGSVAGITVTIVVTTGLWERSPRLAALFVLSITLGLRPGELRKLTWEFVDLNRGVIHVWRSASKPGDTKTPKSKRSLVLPKRAVTALKAHKAMQDRERIAAGSSWQGTNLVFCHEDGSMYSSDALNWRFSKMTRKADIGHWHAYEGRHTAVSIMSSNGVQI
jgi:integrase